MDTFESFVSDFVDGKLEAYMKSEPIPEKDDGFVKVSIKISNFNNWNFHYQRVFGELLGN